MSFLHIDLETRSRCNLLTEGVYNYATDPSTEIICMAYAFDNNPVKLWTPGLAFPREVQDHFTAGGLCYAHNAAFERLMFECVFANCHGVREPQLHQWLCTSYMARCNNMPASLELCARALKLPHQKSLRGRELIRLLSIPQSDGTFNKDPDLLQEMYDYCRQDVEVERAIEQRLAQPSSRDWQDYFVSEQINDAGIRIDVELAAAAADYAEEEQEDLRAQVEILTEGEVTKVRGENLKAWINNRLSDEHKALMIQGKKVTLNKSTRERLLAEPELDAVCREVLECSDAASRASTAKFTNMLQRRDPITDRVYGAFVANGASASGRYSARGLQLHNFPREGFEDPEAVRNEIVEAHAEGCYPNLEGTILTSLAKMLRPALIPPEGKSFVISDWSAIEGRVAPWLADTPQAERKLKLYRDGRDVYIEGYASMHNVKPDTVTKEQRQEGKVAELALQYQGGYRAFQTMARNMGLVIPDQMAEAIKLRWRQTNPWAVDYWATLERAAYSAARNSEVWYQAGRVNFISVDGILAGGRTLLAQLPCGRLLTYPDVRFELDKFDREGLTCMRSAFHPKVNEKHWPRSSLYGGLLLENVTQGTAASILRDSLRECNANGLTVVAHVHDEIVVETDRPEEHKELLEGLMVNVPFWAEGLPLAVEAEIKERYCK